MENKKIEFELGTVLQVGGVPEMITEIMLSIGQVPKYRMCHLDGGDVRSIVITEEEIKKWIETGDIRIEQNAIKE